MEEFEKSLKNSAELEDKTPPSTTLYNRLALLGATVALFLLAGSFFLVQINEKIGINIIAAIYIPVIIIALFSFYLAMCSRLRAKYLASRIAILLCLLIIIGLVIIVIAELHLYGEFYISPFNPYSR